MAWARIDDGIIERLQALGLTEDAIDLHLRAIIYCNKNLTDGYIPKDALRGLTRKRNVQLTVKQLQIKCRWTPCVNRAGWDIHDYLEWNESRAEVLERRAKAAKHMQGVRANVRSHVSKNSEPGSASREETLSSPLHYLGSDIEVDRREHSAGGAQKKTTPPPKPTRPVNAGTPVPRASPAPAGGTSTRTRSHPCPEGSCWATVSSSFDGEAWRVEEHQFVPADGGTSKSRCGASGRVV